MPTKDKRIFIMPALETPVHMRAGLAQNYFTKNPCLSARGLANNFRLTVLKVALLLVLLGHLGLLRGVARVHIDVHGRERGAEHRKNCSRGAGEPLRGAS